MTPDNSYHKVALIILVAAFSAPCARTSSPPNRPNPSQNLARDISQLAQKCDLKQTPMGKKWDDLRNRMSTICKSIANQGFKRNNWFKKGAINRDSPQLLKITTTKIQRVILVVVSDIREINLDMEVRDNTGHVNAQDFTPDLRAVLEWVAYPGKTYTINLRATHGTGNFLLQSFSAPTFVLPARLAGFFDADPMNSPSFETINRRMELLGYTPLDQEVQIMASRNNRFGHVVHVKQDRCYMFTAQGSAGIDHLEARLERDHHLLVADLSRRSETWIRYCAGKSEDLQLSINVPAGSGTITLRTFFALHKTIEHRVGPIIRPRSQSQTFEQSIESMNRRLRDMGYEPAETLFLGNINEGERKLSHFPLRTNECAAVYGLGDSSIIDIDLDIEEANYKFITEENKWLPFPLWGICAPKDQTYRVKLIVLQGNGRAITRIQRLPTGKRLLSNSPYMTFLAQKAIARFGMSNMKLRDSPIELLKSHKSGEFLTRITLSKSSCYGLAIISPSPADTAMLRNHKTNEKIHWQDPGTTAVASICPSEHQTYDVIVTGTDRSETPPHLLIFTTNNSPKTQIRDNETR
jgi:hypothetical protein